MKIKLEVIVTITYAEVRNFDRIIDSLKNNQHMISKVIFVIEKNVFSKAEKHMNYVGKFLETTIIISENGTTKISKLNIASSKVNNANFVLILDEDDDLNRLLIDEIPISEKTDLILTQLNIIINNKEHTYLFNQEIDNWYVDGYFPYFNNHNSIPRGDLFKKVNNLFKNYYFQKHEDVYRSILYISNSSETILLDNPKHPMIKYYIDLENRHESSENNIEKEANSMNYLLDNMANISIVFSDYQELKSSQINALIRIFRTAFPLNEKRIIDESLFLHLENTLKNLGVKTDFESIYHNTELKNFYNQLKDGEKLIWFKID